MRAPILTTGFVSVSLAVAPSVGDTLAGEINQRHVASGKCFRMRSHCSLVSRIIPHL